MIQPKEIIRCNRRTLALTIDKSGALIVKAPLRFPEQEIFKFIEEKSKWIESKMGKIQKVSEINEDLLNFDCFLLFGKKYPVRRSINVKAAVFNANECVIPEGLSKEKEMHKVVLTYKKLASKWLSERTLEIAKVIGAKFDEFKISDTKGRWGCCNSNFCINLNWRVVCLSPALIDYVIVHELCHLKEMNHSPRFWELVGAILPDYKLKRKKVKEMGFLFQIYRDK